jgi:hypothetical protein
MYIKNSGHSNHERGEYILIEGVHDPESKISFVKVRLLDSARCTQVPLEYVSKTDASSLVMQPDKQTYLLKHAQEGAQKRQAEEETAKAEQNAAELKKENEAINKKLKTDRASLERVIANQVRLYLPSFLYEQ